MMSSLPNLTELAVQEREVSPVLQKEAPKCILESVDGSAGTLMSYQVTASVGGKLAQVGSRLVTGAARKMANDFFTGFVRSLSGDPFNGG